MSRLTFSAVALAALVATTAPAPVHAVTYDKLAYLTFSGPVQVPGVTLNAGTYRFHLTNPETSRNVLQVLSNDGATVYTMFYTRPDSRTAMTADAAVSFMETPVGVAPAIKSLFYGGEYRGYEFVYPKGEPNMSPPVWKQPDITYTPNTVTVSPEPITPTETAPEVVFETEPMPAEPEQEPAPPPVLPHTASPLPFVAVGGLASLLAGLGLGVRRRRTN